MNGPFLESGYPRPYCFKSIKSFLFLQGALANSLSDTETILSINDNEQPKTTVFKRSIK